LEAKALKVVREALDGLRRDGSSLIPVLQRIQGELGYLPKEALEAVARELGVPLSKVYGVATFYHQFSLTPPAFFTIWVCMGTACHLKGNAANYELLKRMLKIRPGTNVSEDGVFRLEKARCFGCCSLAPVIKIGDELYGNVTPSKLRRIIAMYRARARRMLAETRVRRGG